jgi:hypothetical protein
MSRIGNLMEAAYPIRPDTIAGRLEMAAVLKRLPSYDPFSG